MSLLVERSKKVMMKTADVWTALTVSIPTRRATTSSHSHNDRNDHKPPQAKGTTRHDEA